MPTIDISKAKPAPSRSAKASAAKRIGVARGKFAVPKVIDEANPAIGRMFDASKTSEP